MNPNELQDRTKKFALRVIKVARALPSDFASRELGKQLLRSGTSVSANYRAARRARSRKEFISKIGIVAEEADESTHWLDLLIDSDTVPRAKLGSLLNESEELMRIFARTRATARSGSANAGARNKIAKSPDRQIAKY